MKTNNRKLTKKNKNVQRATEAQLIAILMANKVPRTLMKSSPFPQSMIRKLVYNEPEQLLQSGTSTFLVKEWRMSDSWDPDSALGGGAVAGFNKLAAIYNLFRVEDFKIRINVSNNENTKPISFGLVFRDVRPSTFILTAADAQNALEVAPTTGPTIVGESSGNSIYRGPWHRISPQAVLGNTISYFGDIDYSGTAGPSPASPSQVLWVALIAYIGAGDLTNGFFLDAYMEFTTRFYSLIGIQE